MNQLQFESSPYLNQHKHNPVNWHAWSESILKEARQKNKPIIVSIGYSTCHWCHVMAHESFEDSETALLMNDYFINIKIDREERPDLDHYFMNAIQAMGISGGWPLHCFLSPDGKPFYGGTYFPPEPKYGRPSWKQILIAIHQAYLDKPAEIIEQANQLNEHLQQLNQLEKNKFPEGLEVYPDSIFKKIQSSMDLENGGFGNHPKFPNTQGIQLLFHLYFLSGDKSAIQHALFSLKQMCLGGIYDHIDGGFCRYSVDANWNVPHFEKMLYDHAQLIQALSIGYTYNKSPFFKRIIIQSLRFFENNMQDECGMFYAAMDADSDGEEGTYYVWTENFLKELLADDYKVFNSIFTFSSLDFTQTDKKVLRIKNSITDDVSLEKSLLLLDPLLTKIRNVRKTRTTPSIDHKMIVSWNAMMVSSYLAWYKAFDDETYLLKAKDLIHIILKLTKRNNIELGRYYINGELKGFGFLEDYAYLIKALLDMFFHTQNEMYMVEAIHLFEYVQMEFKNPDTAIYNMSSSRYADFHLSQLDWNETTYPNPNALLSWACSYFYEYTLDEKYQNISKELISAIESYSLNHPLAMASWVQQILSSGSGSFVVKSNEDSDQLRLLENVYIPGLMRLSQEMDGLSFCFDRLCYAPVSKLKEVVSLFSKYHIFIENQH